MGNSGAKDVTNADDKSPTSEYTVLKDLGTSLNAFRKGDILCDVSLIVDENVYRAHRLVLAASSPYFSAMFTGDFAEATEPLIRLRGVVSKRMPEILKFMYTGQVEISEEYVEELLHDANHLQVTALTDRCYRFLEENMAIHNCITTYGFADKYSNSGLKNKAEEFILKNFPAVSESAAFLDLPPGDLVRLIKEDLLAVDTEDVVCRAVFRWLHSDDETRQPHFAEILKNVRLTFVSTDLLREVDENEDIIKMSTVCTGLVKQALFSKLLAKEQKEKPRALYANSETDKT